MSRKDLKPGVWSYNGVLPKGEDSHAFFEKLIELDEELLLMHGNKVNPLDETLLEAIIHIILTQNTSDVNSDRTFVSLMQRFPTWEGMRTADVLDIADAIKMGGISSIKSKRIIEVLNVIKDRSSDYDLSFVEAMECDDAMEYLMSMPGVGPKSAACALLFSLGRPTFPVDTHVHRVANRLGLVKTKDLSATQRRIAPYVPQENTYQLHVNMVHHGRKICKAIRPRCGDCSLSYDCMYVKGNMEG